jgi:hypothetical protein
MGDPLPPGDLPPPGDLLPPVGDWPPPPICDPLPVGDLLPPVGDLLPPVGDPLPPVGDPLPQSLRRQVTETNESIKKPLFASQRNEVYLDFIGVARYDNRPQKVEHDFHFDDLSALKIEPARRASDVTF